MTSYYWKTDSHLYRTGLLPKKPKYRADCTPWIGKIGCSDFSSPREGSGASEPIVTVPYKKYNHLAGSLQLGDKLSLWTNMGKAKSKFGLRNFSFLQDSYTNDFRLFRLNINYLISFSYNIFIYIILLLYNIYIFIYIIYLIYFIHFHHNIIEKNGNQDH